MNIAIYEKANIRGEQLLQCVRQYWDARQVCCGIMRYAATGMLCQALREGGIDLAFLFLESDPVDGLAAAQAIREISLDCEIIFVAENAAHVAAALPWRAMGYLLWPGDDALDGLMQRFSGCLARRPVQYAVHTRLCDHLVLHEKILYFRSDGHAVHVYVAGLEEPLAHLRRLDDVQKEVAALGYIRCHQSFLVNPQAVARTESRRLVLRDGTELPVSRRFADNVAAGVGATMELHNNSQKSEEQC